MPVIEFRTLGTLDLRGADGRELHSLLAQPKRIALLAYLCIGQPRGFHHRDTLLGLFWPSADQDHARTSLRKALHILRRALGDDAILSRGDEEVAVDFQRVSCDATVFEERLRENRVEESLELYRGDLLTGFFIDDAPEFEHWLHSERTRLRGCAARAAYAMSDQLEVSGNVGAAVSWARRSHELADTDERAFRKLIELQSRAGDRTGAIRAYEAFARHLAAEYETEPTSDTKSLIERIRSDGERAGSEREVRPAAQTDFAPALDSPSVTRSVATGAEKEKRRGRQVRRTQYAAGALAILISATAIWGWMRPVPSKQVVRYTLVVDSTEAMVPGASWWGRLAISPDGTRLAYIGGAGGQLLIRPRNQLHATAVSGTKGANTPFFSPDGQQVGFLTEGHVYIASIDGGPPITVADSLIGVAGASWGRDGFIYADGRAYSTLLRVEAKAGAAPKWFTTLDSASGEIDHRWPDVLPNGKGVVFAVTFDAKNGVKGTPSHAIAVADIPSGRHRAIVNDAVHARYAASGHLLYVTTNRTLMVVPFDQNSMKVTGEATAMIEGMRVGNFGAVDLAVSATGTLVYATGVGQGMHELVWVTRDGRAQSIDPHWQGDFWSLALSPDGKRLAVERRLDGQTHHIWSKQLDRGPSIKLTLEQSGGDSPTWTPDGGSVTFSTFLSFLSKAADTSGLWTTRADGSGQAVLQFHEKRAVLFPVWSPDGKWLIYATEGAAPDSGDIPGIRPGIDTAPVPLVATRFREGFPALSPDGRWLAYTSNESGPYEIYVVPFPHTRAAKWAVSTSGGIDPQWSHSGRELFYRDGAGNLIAVDVKTNPTFSLGRVTMRFPMPAAATIGGKRYAVSSDDRRFLMIRLATSAPDKLIVVENWFEDFKSNARK